ncbi:MAG: peptidoglycan/xylan/chitin deacetylase (PgdA/CDA1 family) [Flavobacterium sp.]|jgi:peptidoglycan/xylan/chitin deacetylase (PgdA/CDA1 family)
MLKIFAILHARRSLVEFLYFAVVNTLVIALFTTFLSTRSYANEEALHSSGVILQYHHVADNTPAITSTSPAAFKAHLNYLSSEKIAVWPLEKLIKALKQGESLPGKIVSLTFDDAYDDIYHNAWPLLRARNWPFTLFIASDLVGKKGYLTWDQIREMNQGGMSIANHTQTHTHLVRKLDTEGQQKWLHRVKKEILNAELAISDQIPTLKPLRMKFIAFPYGEYNRDLLNLIASLGYVGLGQQSGAVDKNATLLVLPRYPLSGIYQDLSTFKIKVWTQAMPLLSTSFIDPVLGKGNKRPGLKMKFSEKDYQFEQLKCYGPGDGMQVEKIPNENTYIVRSTSDLPVGRSRYNCTMPTSTSHKEGEVDFYWFSQLWIRKNSDGTWVSEH